MGLAKWQTHGKYFGSTLGEGESFTSRGFVGVRRSGSTVSYIRVNYLDDINIGVLAFRSLRVKWVLSLPPPPSLFYISRLDKRRYREIRFARCLVLSDAVENSILKVRSSIVRLQWNIFPDQSCFSKIRVSSFECFDDTSCDSKSDVMHPTLNSLKNRGKSGSNRAFRILEQNEQIHAS